MKHVISMRDGKQTQINVIATFLIKCGAQLNILFHYQIESLTLTKGLICPCRSMLIIESKMVIIF